MYFKYNKDKVDVFFWEKTASGTYFSSMIFLIRMSKKSRCFLLTCPQQKVINLSAEIFIKKTKKV